MASLLRKPITESRWPVLAYGSLDRTRGKGGIGSPGEAAQPRLTEPDLAKVYLNNWGVLSPAHPHAGSSWWRVRYLMAADAGCVLSADLKEAACLGSPYVVASDRAVVERLDENDLRNLAAAQRDRLNELVWPKDRVVSTLRSLLS